MKRLATSQRWFTSLALGGILLFALSSIVFTASLDAGIDRASVWVRSIFGHFYLYLGLGCVLFLILVSLGPWGRLRLGKPGEPAEFSRWAWISMLYSTGMGAGILLRAVQEPVYMRERPPLKLDIDPGQLALEYTFFQWGFTAWAFYGLFGLLVGWAMHRHGLPGAPSSAIGHPGIRRRVGWIFDLLALWATVFGVVAAVSLGARQISGGLKQLFGLEPDLFGGTLIIAAVCVVGGFTALLGIRSGIRRLSTWNISLTLALLAFVWLAGNPLSTLAPLVRALVGYLWHFVPLSVAWGDFDPGMDFLRDWTYYYWAFWIAWAPFTGIFIARISKGRSLREFLMGVLLVPSLGTFSWFAVFGQGAFGRIDAGLLSAPELESIYSSLFVFLGTYPLGDLTAGVALTLLFTFLITSVDSAIYVLGMFSLRARSEPSRRLRGAWTVFLGLSCAGIYFLAGLRPRLDVLQTAQKLLVVTSLPLALGMALLPLGFWRELDNKRRKDSAQVGD